MFFYFKYFLKNYNIADPIEQFEVFFLSCFSIVDSTTLLLLINSIFLFFLFYNLPRQNIIGYCMVKLLFFFKNLFFIFFTEKQQAFFAFFFYLFIFIFFNNLIGLLPYTYTLTSSFLLTLFLAFIVISGIAWLGFEQRRWSFFNVFFPKGVPVIILFLLVVLELISYLVRLFSLSLRLFANLLAGHLLLKILLSFFWFLLLSASNIFFLSIFFFGFLIVGIIFLEILIAFLQAYVFVFLSLIYLHEIF